MADQLDTFSSAFLPEVESPEPDELDESLDPNEVEGQEVVVESRPLQPLGRSWAFNFDPAVTPGFVAVQGRGMLETQGFSTLRGWIEKCLRTPRGSSPIHPEEYGVENLDDFIGQSLQAVSFTEMTQRITDALTFHPRITDVEDFEYEAEDDGDEGALFVSFTVVVDHENQRFELPFDNLNLTET